MAAPSSPRNELDVRAWLIRMTVPLLLLAGGAAVLYSRNIRTVFGSSDGIQAVSKSTSNSMHTFVGEQASYEYNVTAPNHQQYKDEDLPRIVWLASYPNSGTSYTLRMIKFGSNRSTATNYGREETYERDDSTPIHANHPDGPFWPGTNPDRNTHDHIRQLPESYVLTKTHCGGRCFKCPATEYVLNVTTFLKECQRAHGFHTVNGKPGVHVESYIDTSRIAKVVHLIRNPLDNVVARYHMERHKFSGKRGIVNETAEERYPSSIAGFRRWCKDTDHEFQPAEHRMFKRENIIQLLKQVPCRAEFYKYIQWHNYVVEIMSSDDLLFDAKKDPSRVLVVYYEDYETKLNETATTILNFLEQKLVMPLWPFRPLPSYADHYTAQERQVAKELMKAVSSDETWRLIQHYFD